MNKLESNRTIIDILRKGNQELFHSAMIAWLLDPSGEHGLGDAVMKSLALVVKEKGHPEFFDAIDRIKEDLTVGTEVKEGRSRYDIVIYLDYGTGRSKRKVVIENKTKSFGGKAQLETYIEDEECILLIGLGLTDVSFKQQTSQGNVEKLVYICYGDILNILRSVEVPQHIDAAFKGLIVHYMEYLERELGLLEDIQKCFENGDGKLQDEIGKRLTHERYTENDMRFYNLFYLETFMEWLDRRSEGLGRSWISDKNQPGGVIMHNAPKAEDTKKQYYWFHLLLDVGICAGSSVERCGEFQLRTGKIDGYSNKDRAAKLKQQYGNVLPDIEFKGSQSNKWTSFYLCKIPLKRHHLFFNELAKKMLEFVSHFDALTSGSS